MDNYKIKVKDEAENVQIQNAFFALGYGWSTDRKKEITTSQDMIDEGYSSNYKIAFIYAGNDGRLLNGDDSADGYRSYVESDAKEITLPELLELTTAKQPQDPALISGAEALRALADGKEVECQNKATFEWFNCLSLSVAELVEGSCQYRLKPQTIKLELELPKPFQPQMGDRYWIIHPAFKSGYTEAMFGEADKHQSFQQFGAYRTEEDVKKAVEQLRKIRGTNS